MFFLLTYEFVIGLTPTLIKSLFFLQALEKSKYEQSLDSVRRFIAIAEKELELYYRHVALYGDPNNRNPLSVLDSPDGNSKEKGNHGIQDKKFPHLNSDYFSATLSETKADSTEMELSEAEDSFEDESLSMNESDSEENSMSGSNGDQEKEVYFTKLRYESVSSTTGSSSMAKRSHYYNNNNKNQCI